MDKEELKRWLNKLSKTVKQLSSTKDFDEHIQLCPQMERGSNNIPYIQLYSGIQIIAETFKLVVDTKEDEDSVTRSFMWNGVMFLQYDRKGECL